MSKKGKRVKGRTVDLGDFLPENNSGAEHGFTRIVAKDLSDDTVGSNVGHFLLPKGPVSTRGGNIDESKVPTEPPFVAFLGNLPFEIVEEEIIIFFNDLKVTGIRFAKGPAERFRGFGYADFEDRASLIEALGYDGEQLRGREIRVSLPDDNEGDGRGGYNRDRRMRGGGFGARSERPVERDLPSDWRAAARDDQSNRGFDSYNRSDRHDGNGGFGDRDRGSSDSNWRSEGRSFNRYEPPRDRPEYSSGPTERPKLKIAPRTKEIVPIEVQEIGEPEPEKKPERVKIEKPKAADIFGAAKPVDTAAKLQEIEKRLEAKRLQEEEELAKQQEKQEQQSAKGSSKDSSPQHESSNEPQKKWRDEIREEKDKKERKQRSERRAPTQVVEESTFNATSKNKYAGLEVGETQEDSDAEDKIQAEN